MTQRVATSNQCKALLIIFLLAGNEAVRVNQESQSTQTFGHTLMEKNPEAEWENVNEQCTMTIRGCKAKSSKAKSKCAYRPLPLDGLSWSKSCRLSDDYMLKNDRAKYLKLQSEILTAKVGKFAEKCMNTSSIGLKCKRRSMHMMRAIEFMAKAQDKALMQSLSEEERDNEKQLIDMSLGTLSEALGPDGNAILELKRKLAGDAVSAQKDPHGTVMKAINLVHQLLRGNDNEKQAAREAIAAMPEPSELSARVSTKNTTLEKLGDELEEEADDVRKLVDRVNALDQPDEMDHLEEEEEEANAHNLVEHINAQTKGSALLEQTINKVVVKGIAYVVIVVLVVLALVYFALEVITIIASWALLALLGCGVYAAVKKTTVGEALKCTGKVFLLPFTLMGKAAKAVCKGFGGCKSKNKNNQNLLQLQPSMLQLEPTIFGEGFDAFNGTGPMNFTHESE